MIRSIAGFILARICPSLYAKRIGVQFGSGCRFLGLTPGTFGTEPYLIRLGNNVSVTSGVRFITHDGGVWLMRSKRPEADVFAPIIVGDNVFVGINSIIMPGVRIGNNCIIGAGAVVTRDIPDDVVAAGVPARPIKTTREYLASIEGDILETKGMSRIKKREFLLKHFGRTA